MWYIQVFTATSPSAVFYQTVGMDSLMSTTTIAQVHSTGATRGEAIPMAQHVQEQLPFEWRRHKRYRCCGWSELMWDPWKSLSECTAVNVGAHMHQHRDTPKHTYITQQQKRNGQPNKYYCKRNKITMLTDIPKKEENLLTYYAHLTCPKLSPCLPPPRTHPPHTCQPIQFTDIKSSFFSLIILGR